MNWVILGLLYASYYLCRYNFRWATPALQKEYGFAYAEITQIMGCWFWAYGVGQLLNGMMTDRIGGKRAMLIGSFGTIAMNLAFGAASFSGTFSTFASIWLLNGYFQAFGAPGMIKINTAWFQKSERGTFAGIFGFMIQLGQLGINHLAPAILGGFAVLVWTVPALHWRWLFWVPPVAVAVFALLLAVFVRETPEKAGFKGEDVETSEIGFLEGIRTIVRHPLVWFYAMAYACTGAVRHGSDHLAVLYFIKELGLSPKHNAVAWTLQLMPLVAVSGSFLSGLLSDRFFRGRRAPVSMVLYLLETCVIVAAVFLTVLFGVRNIAVSCTFLVLIAFTANSTHSLVGTAAPMDIGGRKLAGFAAGVIDSFQYFGAGIAVPMMGLLLDRFGWSSWFPAMAGFGLFGALAMAGAIRRQRLSRLTEDG